MEHGGLNFVIDLALMLIFANLGGIAAQKLNQPSVLGQILAGLLAGPAVLNIVTPNEIISTFAELGVILLMFLAGMETDLYELKKSAGASASIAVGGVIMPMVMGILAIKILYPSEGIISGAFVGVILAATSISITVQVLREIEKLNDKTGIGILGAAVIDDVLSIIVLTLVIGVASPGEGSGILFVVLKIVAFFVLTMVAGRIFTTFMNKNSSKMLRDRNVGAFAIIICFILAFVAEEFGVAAIIGAYFTGIVFSLTPYNHRVEKDVSSIAFTLFTPVFFLNIGLIINLDGVCGILVPLVVLMIVAMVSKIIGCGLGAKLMKFSARESIQIGVGMIPRGEVGLIVANVAKSGGFISDNMFTATILVVVLTTIITPPMLKKAYE
ncbi:Kef-type K+ transport system, membrane component KefB [Dethiosulfatibacter aminovorans DSM 17477]|uniref:Kef-type K+ transport system, membrane component KefB n=1 Tax=Dethiosulfatibacter aminovorans DSM 17477 TaxID=1121476 RepID=A0A1M6HJI1_9FIRM|nr:cation:proton antiporter [Dethiosulfatibacter aminovorans]SHJ22376.1 Kef-type K+ transport system, membrane component KefB [Dethiosulfatibacter aminovorans DSM 17477]